MASELQERLNRIVGKSNVLVERYQSVLAQKTDVEERLAQAVELNERLKLEVEHLKRENEFLRIAHTVAASPDQVAHVRATITRLVRDIDKCITQLNT